MGNKSWVQERRDTIYDSQHMRVYADRVRLQNDVVVDDYSVVSLNDGVLIVATDENGSIIMLQEYKYAVDETMLCVPAGGLEEGEDIIEAGLRELQEETGYVASDGEYVGYVHEYPSKASHKLHIIRVKNAVKSSPTAHEETEQIESIHLLSIDELSLAMRQQKIKLASTLSAVVLAMPEVLISR